MPRLRIGTRRSRLALWQTEQVRAQLLAAWPELEVEVVPFTTQGDRVLHKALPEIGGKGLFTAELEDALRAGHIDLAVHSLKDLPTEQPPGLTLAAVLPREDPRDAWLSKHGRTLHDLPPNPVIGTSSQRRAAQVQLLRPDARIVPLRGNVDTRVRKVLDPNGPYDGAVLALAGLRRLGLEAAITAVLSLETWLPAPGQGAIAVQSRADDPTVQRYLEPLNDPATHIAVEAERAFLAGLGGGCALPVAAWGRVQGEKVHLTGLFVQGGVPRRATGQAPATLEAARALGFDLAARVRGTAPSTREPATGPRVLVLRAAEQAPAMAAALRAAGFRPVLYPVLRIEPAATPELTTALARLNAGHYATLVLTSVNGVAAVRRLMEAHGWRIPATVRIAVIGPATAAALRSWGYTPTVAPRQFVAEALADALGRVQGQRILLARADRARPTLRHLLRQRGAQVDEVVAYHTRLVQPEAPPPEVEVIAFTSPSTVEGLRAAYAHWQRPWPPEATIACIGPITARAAHAAGLPVHQVAQTYTIPGLVAALSKKTADTRG